MPPAARRAFAALTTLALLAGCGSSEEPAAPEVRPVRVVTVEERPGGETVSLTGTVQAEATVDLAFRINGRMIERLVNVGDPVAPGQVVARLDPENEQNALRAARADVAAAMGQLTEAQNNYQRQNTLLRDGWTTRVRYDEARQTLETTQSRADAAQAQLNIAENQVSYTELHADSAGTVTAVGAEPGEVVQAGRMIVQVARKDGRDAVFDVPAQVKDMAPADPEIAVVLTSDPTVTAIGRVREVAPRADPTTGHLRGQGRACRAAGRDASRLERDRADGGPRAAGDRDPGLGADPQRPPAGGLGGRSGDHHRGAAQHRDPAP